MGRVVTSSEAANALVDRINNPRKVLEVPQRGSTVWINTSRRTIAELVVLRREQQLYRNALRELCASVHLRPQSAVYSGRRLLGFTVPDAMAGSRTPPGWTIRGRRPLLVPAESISPAGRAFTSVEISPSPETSISGFRSRPDPATPNPPLHAVDAGAALIVWADETVGMHLDGLPDPSRGFEVVDPDLWVLVHDYAAEDVRDLNL